jgi:hypothetical protein
MYAPSLYNVHFGEDNIILVSNTYTFGGDGEYRSNSYNIYKNELKYVLELDTRYVTYNDIEIGKVKRCGSYSSGTSINVNPLIETHYVTLSSNSSLGCKIEPSSFNGLSVNVYVYTSSSVTITIPTTGNYISMCGSSYTTKAGGWVEFNLAGVNGKWHIAMLEQQ